ncbi:MFS transporter [Galbitalea sp. SE-J8]|uniref:MFS transporter n=1 Tax=Galbitalea sp. SE-J8 TaxID=3054952 RepID=UPI00259C68BB|nr:MFS transporter [Galbitalea sp. SE-J8]MDM4763426.1 MFS transporter [Galbitalea sp. SE-J8]
MSTNSGTASQPTSPPLSRVERADNGRSLRLITTVMAVTCGFAVANVYYAQPLLGLIAHDFSVSRGAVALVVTLTQLGYAVGMVVLLPLGDMVENRRLAACTLVATAAALTAAALAPSFTLFLVLSVLVGLASVVTQLVVPIAAHLAPPGRGGRMVGRVMLGLLLGIMLARTLSSLVADAWGWRSIFLVSAAIMLVLSLLVWRVLPRRVPHDAPSYPRLMASIGRLIVAEPALRRRAICQGLLFGAFSAFWTTVAFELTDQFGMGQVGIAMFALVGAAGAIAAPIAGWLGDHGRGRIGSGAALTLAVLGLLIAAFFSSNLIALAAAAVMLDFAVQSHQVLSQHEIYALRPDARSRLNTVFMATVFTCGAACSAIAGTLHDRLGWPGVCLFAGALPLVGLGVWVAHAASVRRTARGDASVRSDG